MVVGLLAIALGIWLGTWFWQPSLPYISRPGASLTPATQASISEAEPEPWLVSACTIHDRIQHRDRFSSAEPLHAFLGLDATKAPFYPPNLSSHPGKPLYQHVRNEILERHAQLQRTSAQKLRTQRAAHDDEKWTRSGHGEFLYLLGDVTRFLLDDEFRREYAAVMVPGMMKWGKGRREGAMRKLCEGVGK